jgi:UDP-N-acetylmuramoyl-tripeptide--D-alanyl-D-alanine ligase
MYVAALVWRRLMFRTTFVAVTGSMGKTTAKECLAAALASRFPTFKTRGNQNDWFRVAEMVLRVRPWHRFAVIEVATSHNGMIRRSARAVRPDIAVVLKVGRAHMMNFRTLETVAAEKGQLVAALRKGGIAVLNADDPRVARMADPSKHRVVWFGSAAGTDFQAEDLSSRWPERFSFLVRAAGEERRIETQLVGTHWVNSVLAALAAAHVCGVPLEDAAAAIARVEPSPGAMQPAALPCGAVVIRDEKSGSIDQVGPSFDVLAQASAARKIVVMSDVSDDSQKPRTRLAAIGRAAARVADCAVFVGDRAGYGVRGAVAAGMDAGAAHAFASLEAAAEFLRTELRAGDLVLLKGRATDHISRLYFAQLGPVGCWKTDCKKTRLCDRCDEPGGVQGSSGVRRSAS